MKIVAAHNKDNFIRVNSSSGGVFSILAEQILNKGGVVYGAAFDENWGVEHIRITDSKDLDKLRRSKYVFSKFAFSVKNVEEDLKQNRKVLFSGVPCQVAAVRKKIGNNTNLLCVEVICHGAPQAYYWYKYLGELCSLLGENNKNISSINFRDKRTGWKGYSFTIKFNDGKEFSQKASSNAYMRAFLSNYTLRKVCFGCQFKYPNGSLADITLGDFWGIEKVASNLNNNLGTTIVIVRSDQGEIAAKRIDIDSIIDFSAVRKYNRAICVPPTMPVDYEKFQYEAKLAEYLTPVINEFIKTPKNGKLKKLIKKCIRLFK